MMYVMILFFVLAVVFSIAGVYGLIVFPDTYTRLQASSLCGTTGVFSVFIGCMILEGFSNMMGRILVIALFFLISGPTSTHIIARFAWETGMIPWRKTVERDGGHRT